MIGIFKTPLALSVISNAVFIRKFEELLLKLFSTGKIQGTTHTCIGQELVPAIIGGFLGSEDFIFSNHRGHGHFLSAGGDSLELLFEILGDARGVCGGKGGSQHLYSERFLANGILAGNSGFAVGLALSKKLNSNGIVVYYMGDGSICEGIFYEALNIASIFRVPTFFVIENNQIAQTTHQHEFLAGSITKRFEAFGVKVVEIDDYELENNLIIIDSVIKEMRHDRRPIGLVVNTRRLGSHSKGDDTRSAGVIAQLKSQDLITFLERNQPTIFNQINDDVHLKIKHLEDACTASRGTEDAVDIFENAEKTSPDDYFNFDNFINFNHETLIKQIRFALEKTLSQKENSLILGEDISDPYGGAFKATLGLSTKYPDRVISTPISEAVLVGISGGLSMGGRLPILEIMFGDFVTLCFDQLVNHVSKYASMYPGIFKESIIIRMPMGGYRGYGATHSQTLEKYLVGIPGVFVVAVNLLIDIERLYEWAIWIKKPIIFIENKSDYGSVPLLTNQKYANALECNNYNQSNGLPITKINIGPFQGKIVTISYGHMIQKCVEAALEFFKKSEIPSSIIAITFINKIDYKILNNLLKEASLVVIVEEGYGPWGWGSEVKANLKGAYRIIRHDVSEEFIPSGIDYEKKCLPSVESILKILNENAV